MFTFNLLVPRARCELATHGSSVVSPTCQTVLPDMDTSGPRPRADLQSVRRGNLPITTWRGAISARSGRLPEARTGTLQPPRVVHLYLMAGHRISSVWVEQETAVTGQTEHVLDDTAQHGHLSSGAHPPRRQRAGLTFAREDTGHPEQIGHASGVIPGAPPGRGSCSNPNRFGARQKVHVDGFTQNHPQARRRPRAVGPLVAGGASGVGAVRGTASARNLRVGAS